MQLSNTEDEYGLIARFFHWAIAVLILGLLPMGLFMNGMENTPFKLEIYALHKSFGLLVFFLGVARIVWRLVSPPPDHLESHQHWEVTLASAAHFWLYVCVIGMPLSGWLMSSAAEFPVPFFGMQMPQLIDKNVELGQLFGQIHEVLAFTLLFILGLHVAGALKHHIIDKDETLQRMAARTENLALPAMIVLIVGASFGFSALLIAQGFFRDGTEQRSLQQNSTTMPSNIAMPDTSALAENGWAIVPGQSKLQFKATLYNAPFTGDIANFSGPIIFNPDDLENASADITIDMKNVTTGDADRDSNIQGPDWFATEVFPEARFTTIEFEKADGNNYVAVGNLTIRNITMPLSIPFALEIKGNRAHMVGRAVLNRLNFEIGDLGDWKDPASVGHDVEVLIDITAIR